MRHKINIFTAIILQPAGQKESIRGEVSGNTILVYVTAKSLPDWIIGRASARNGRAEAIGSPPKNFNKCDRPQQSLISAGQALPSPSSVGTSARPPDEEHILARPRAITTRNNKHRRSASTPDNLIAVTYARVSTPDQQREGYSIPAQQGLLNDYAAANGLGIVGNYVDVETAKKSGRREFEAMLKFLRQNPQVRTLLVEKTDRLYRNLKDWSTIDDLGLEIHLVKENQILSDDCRSAEKFMHGIKVLMAKNYIDNLAEETSKGMLEKARQGFWPSAAPIGYVNVTEASGRKVIKAHPQNGPLMGRVFEWFSTGKKMFGQRGDLASP